MFKAPAAASSTSVTAASANPSVTEYSVRVPKTIKNKHHVMRFNYNLNVDFAQWRTVKMERENNMREYKGAEEEQPKFGAGSEYNRELKEEARRKKFGIIAKKYNPDAQPWIVKVGGKSGKKFRGIREGGVSENAAFYVFTHAPDGAIEAYPLNEWYNFQPIQRYKALTAEEAEEEFGRRRKCVNMWSMKMRMKLKNKDEEEPEDPEECKAMKGTKGGDKKDLKISEMDEWMDSSDDSSSEEEKDDKKRENDNSDNEDKAKLKKAKGKAAAANQKKKKRDLDDEAFEDSDDGDEEGRELDYISDSSDSESEPEGKVNKELKSVAEEDALRKLLTSDEESDEDKSDKDKDKSDEEKEKLKKDNKMEDLLKDDKEKEKKEKRDKEKKTKMQKFYEAMDKAPGSGRASDFSSDSDDSDVEDEKKMKKKIKKEVSANNSRSGTPVDGGAGTSSASGTSKRKADIVNMSDNSNSPQSTPAKKIKTEAPSLPTAFTNYSSSSKDNCGITEDAVRRYLMRKPMTTTELLTKFKNKKTGVSREELVDTMTQILKKINPVKQTIQGKMYLSIKTK
ncbi:unnamed protein product [Diamesa serratosioi]